MNAKLNPISNPHQRTPDDQRIDNTNQIKSSPDKLNIIDPDNSHNRFASNKELPNDDTNHFNDSEDYIYNDDTNSHVFTESNDESQSEEDEDDSKKDNKDKVISKMSYIIEYILLIND